MSSIVLDPVVFNRAGYETLGPDAPAPPAGGGAPPPPKQLDPLDKGLSYMVFCMTYTRDRDDWANNKPYGPGQSPLIAKNALMAILAGKFPNVPATEREIFIDAHIAASLYIDAKAKRDAAAPGSPLAAAQQLIMDAEELIYKQKMSFICAQLYEYSLGHDFSMSW